MTKKRDWNGTIQAWKASGQSVSRFCADNRISTSAFYLAKRRITEKQKDLRVEESPIPRFVEVNPKCEPDVKPVIRLTSATGYTLEVFL